MGYASSEYSAPLASKLICESKLKMPASSTEHRLIDLLKLLGVAGLYALLSALTLTYLAGDSLVNIIWPPSGLAMAVMLVGERRYAWSIFLGAFLFNAAVMGKPPVMSAGLATAAALEALLGSWLITRSGRFNFNFLPLRELLRLVVLAGFVGVSAGALIGTITLYLSGFTTADTYLQTLLHWWMGDVLGIILLTPLILVWRLPPRHWLQPKHALEVILVLGLTFLLGQIVFLGWFHDFAGPYAKGFFMFLFVALAAVRLGTHGVLTVLLMVAVQGDMGALQNVGYFANDLGNTHLVNYWLYMVTLSIVGITLATYIAAEKQDKETLREQEEFFRMITENIDDLIAVLDLEGRRLYNSPSYDKLFGDAIILQHSNSFAEVHPDDREHVKQVFRETVQSGIGQRIEFRFVLPDGNIRDMESRGGVIKNSEGMPLLVVVVSHDITERKQLEEKTRNLAFYDILTQLPNRRMLDDRLSQAMAASKRSGKYGALLFLDLDNFKPLNDQHGHDVGDRLLIEVARRITSCVREVDTVARFGGDEFVVMLSPLHTNKGESTQQAEIVAEKIRVSLAEPYLIKIRGEGNIEKVIEHHCTSSIGVVLFINHEASQEEIVKWADMAMYRAKEDGRNRIRFHH